MDGWLVVWMKGERAIFLQMLSMLLQVLAGMGQELTELFKFQGSRSFRIIKVDCMTFVYVCGSGW